MRIKTEKNMVYFSAETDPEVEDLTGLYLCFASLGICDKVKSIDSEGRVVEFEKADLSQIKIETLTFTVISPGILQLVNGGFQSNIGETL